MLFPLWGYTILWALMAGHFLVSRLNVFIVGIIPFVLVPNSCSSLDTSSPSPVFSLDVFTKHCHTLFFYLRSKKAGSLTVFPNLRNPSLKIFQLILTCFSDGWPTLLRLLCNTPLFRENHGEIFLFCIFLVYFRAAFTFLITLSHPLLVLKSLSGGSEYTYGLYCL